MIEAEPDRGVPEDVWGLLDLWHGECRGGGVVDAERGRGGTVRDPRAVLAVEGGRCGATSIPIRGMMQGKLRVQGDLPTIMRYVRAANELVHLTGTVDTEFPDEA